MLSSATTLVSLAREQGIVEIPDSVQLTEEEARFWPVFASARLPTDWRRMDLLQLGKVCKLEVSIRDHQAVLDEQGPIIRQPNGSRVANPLVAVVLRLQRLQLAILGSLSLGQRADGRSLASREARGRTFEHNGNGHDDFYAKH